MSIQDYHDHQTMCLSFCYAGRTGHCNSAGKDNDQVNYCLSQYRRDRLKMLEKKVTKNE